MRNLDDYKVDVPEGHSGDWSVERFTITPAQESFSQLRAAINYRAREYVKAGAYTRLMRNGVVVMSDTQAEVSDHILAIHRAQGHVLLNGLGLGVALQGVARKPEVEHITVIEISPDVIGLVASHYLKRFGNKIDVVQADAMTFKPPRNMHYDLVWHDIWDTICDDNLEAMKHLHRRYGKRAKWQGSWARELLGRCR